MKLISVSHSIAFVGLALVLLVSGCATHHHYDSSSERDRMISQQVANGLNNQPYHYPGVNVSTLDRVVELQGYVNTPAQKAQAAEIASAVPGVRRVIDKLTVVALPTGRAPIIVQPPGY